MASPLAVFLMLLAIMCGTRTAVGDPQRPIVEDSSNQRLSPAAEQEPHVLQTVARGFFTTIESHVDGWRVTSSSWGNQIGSQIRQLSHPRFVPRSFAGLDVPKTMLGYPDLVTWLNHQRQAGITPDNNLAKTVLQLYGLELAVHAVHDRELICSDIGMSVDPQPSGFVTWLQYYLDIVENAPSVQERRALRRRLYEQGAQADWDRPWRRDDCPDVHRWLETISPVLRQLEMELTDGRFYEPIIPTHEEVSLAYSVPLLFRPGRAFQAAYRMRINRALGHHEASVALKDLRTLHLLTCKVPIAQSPSVTHVLFFCAAEDSAYQLDALLLARERLRGDQATRQLRSYKSLPAVPPLSATMWSMRCETASLIAWSAVRGPRKLAETFGLAEQMSSFVAEIMGNHDESGEDDVTPTPLAIHLPSWAIDWQVVSDTLDVAIREIERIVNIESSLEMIAAAAQFDRSVKNATFHITSRDSWDQATHEDRPRRELLSDDIATLMKKQSLPSVESLVKARLATVARRRVTMAGYALAKYREDHGHFPGSLGELVPNYLAEAPLDPFSEAPCVYRIEKDHCIIYSVGRNQRDDQGMSDWNAEPRTDDFAVVLQNAR